MGIKAVFAVWNDVRVSDLNRLLRPYNVRLVIKSSKDWGDQVHISAQPVEAKAKAVRVAAVAPPGGKKEAVA
jgi:hypothetical protein